MSNKVGDELVAMREELVQHEAKKRGKGGKKEKEGKRGRKRRVMLV